MENDYLEPDFDSGFDSEFQPEELNDRAPRAFPKRKSRFRLNPKAQNTKKHRNLPTKSTNEMTIRKARRLLFGARTPGRPSKSLSDQLKQAKQVLQSAGEPLRRKNTKVSTRSRGRPRKLITVKKEKRPRGRPRKHPVAAAKPKRPRGRPRKPLDREATIKVKRARGRPRKNPLQQLVENVKERRKKSQDKPKET